MKHVNNILYINIKCVYNFQSSTNKLRTISVVRYIGLCNYSELGKCIITTTHLIHQFNEITPYIYIYIYIYIYRYSKNMYCTL